MIAAVGLEGTLAVRGRRETKAKSNTNKQKQKQHNNNNKTKKIYIYIYAIHVALRAALSAWSDMGNLHNMVTMMMLMSAQRLHLHVDVEAGCSVNACENVTFARPLTGWGG